MRGSGARSGANLALDCCWTGDSRRRWRDACWRTGRCTIERWDARAAKERRREDEAGWSVDACSSGWPSGWWLSHGSGASGEARRVSSSAMQASSAAAQGAWWVLCTLGNTQPALATIPSRPSSTMSFVSSFKCIGAVCKRQTRDDRQCSPSSPLITRRPALLVGQRRRDLQQPWHWPGQGYQAIYNGERQQARKLGAL